MANISKVYPVFMIFYDHASTSSWMTRTELESFKPELIYQVGWLVNEDDQCYRVSGQVCQENGDVGDTMVILKSTVTHFEKLKIKIPNV